MQPAISPTQPENTSTITQTLVLVERLAVPHVTVLRLNRPADLNALSLPLMTELRDRLQELELDAETRVVVITGNERAFAAGADIKAMAGKTAIDMWITDQFAVWDGIRKFKKPLIAAVSGFALGGGCELAMLCDMIVASDTAQFGQPEIKIGVIPGAGGTQRLTRAIGKARAMEMVLSGKFISAIEAERFGLVNKVVPVENYMHEALRFAQQFTAYSPLALRAAKEAVNGAYEAFLQEGLMQERRNFYLLFSSDDQKEGMAAFIEKRKPEYKGR
jgi:enoyl-CoA hydratase